MIPNLIDASLEGCWTKPYANWCSGDDDDAILEQFQLVKELKREFTVKLHGVSSECSNHLVIGLLTSQRPGIINLPFLTSSQALESHHPQSTTTAAATTTTTAGIILHSSFRTEWRR